LVVALNDADARILYTGFFAQEGTLSTFQALHSVWTYPASMDGIGLAEI
jgi:hypothetical protein